MTTADKHWIITLVFAVLAVAFAAVGLGLDALYPGAAPLVAFALLACSLGSTAIAFARLALRVRRLELENEGLVEEIAREFDTVRERMDLFGAKVAEAGFPAEGADAASLRRVTVK